MWSGRSLTPASRRDRLAVLLALAAVVIVGVVFFLARGMHFLMPGPLASAHGAIEACSNCHTSSGDGKLSWVHGLVSADRLADSKACVSCHQMPETAFNSHGASTAVLAASTKRLMKTGAETPIPRSARAQSIAFPADTAVSGGLACATCHQEHQGANFDLKKVAIEKCQSCHVVKFDSFDGHHPEFEAYPFRRRTRIIFDHAGHFEKHFPETAAKTPTTSVPAACASCHNSSKDKRIMSVAPFEQTCSSCHLDQITGKERISGPKGVAFLSLPGLDLAALKKKKLNVGEWPDASEAALTPFMKVLIARNKKGRDLIKKVVGLNLLDLGNASTEQIKAVADLAWEIKGLFFALIKGQASDVLAEIEIGGVKPTADVIAELTASFPRDVIVGAQLQWLPNLAAEMASRPGAGLRPAAQPKANEEPAGASAAERAVRSIPLAGADKATGKGQEGQAVPPPSGKTAERQPAAGARLPPKAADQTDDLLFPTEEEQRAMKDRTKGDRKAAQPREAAAKSDGLAPKSIDAASAEPAQKATAAAPAPRAPAAPVVGIESEVEPETWAAYGGWYRQDNAIFYRPVGHKDKLIYSWLRLARPMVSEGGENPAAGVFDDLTGKEAPGSCTKCHSIDLDAGKRRTVNFTPLTIRDKHGRFTSFVHEPHFSIVDKRGCLTCHVLEKSSPYLKSYEQTDPQAFASNFGEVKKTLCQTCHTNSGARQDCLTCHKYHVHGAVTPITSTKLPGR